MEATGFEPGHEVKISVDGARRTLNSRFVDIPNSLQATVNILLIFLVDETIS